MTRTSLLSLLLLACGPSNPGTEIDAGTTIDATSTIDGAGRPDGAPDGGGGTRTVTVSGGVHRVLDTGVIDQPYDFSSGWVDALLADGTSLPCVAAGAGSCTIADVPAGPFVLRESASATGPFWLLETSSSTIDLSASTLGRPPTTAGTATPVTFNIGNLEAWKTTDLLQLFSSNAGAFVWDIEDAATAGSPAAGATTLAMTFDWSATGAPLVDSTPGDSTTVYQMATRSGGVEHLALSRVLTSALSVDSGVAATLNGTFTAVTASGLSLDWRRGSFAALRAESNPATTRPALHYLAAAALPGAFSRGLYSGFSYPVLGFVPELPGDTDVTFTLAYGDPFPAAWDRFVLAGASFPVEILATGATTPAILYGGAFSERPLSEYASSSVVAPTLTPPTSPEIAGASAWTPGAVGLSPVISWSAPAHSVPTSTMVNVYRIDLSGGGTALTGVIYLRTTGTDVAIPSGVLESGARYVAVLTAVRDTAEDVEAAPYTRGMPYHWASVVTAPFTP